MNEKVQGKGLVINFILEVKQVSDIRRDVSITSEEDSSKERRMLDWQRKILGVSIVVRRQVSGVIENARGTIIEIKLVPLDFEGASIVRKVVKEEIEADFFFMGQKVSKNI